MDSGPLVRGARGGELVKNPLHQIVRDNADFVRVYARELRLTPRCPRRLRRPVVGLTTLASQPATRTTRRRPPSLDPATRYASDVLAGKVVAGRLVRLACQRHLDDLRAKGRLVWKPELADRAAGGDEFGENLLTPGDFNIDRLDDPLYHALPPACGRHPSTSTSREPSSTTPTSPTSTTRSPGSPEPWVRRS